MHIEFRNLILHNFMSFGHAELKINDDGFIRVTGINNNPDDNAVSNGSGKSSLWEAIVWAITGDTIRGTKQVSNLYGVDGTFVDIEFYLDKTKYRIIRAKDHKELKTSLQIIIDGKDCSGKGIRDSEKLLTHYLPDITASLLGSVIILGQGLPQKFTNNSPSGRKEVLEKLSKSDFMIEDLKTRVNERKIDLNRTIRELQDNIIELTSKKSILERQIVEANEALLSYNVSEWQEKINSNNQKLDALTATINEINSRISDIISKKDAIQAEINSRNTDYLQEIEFVTSQQNLVIESEQNSLNELNAKIGALQKEIKRMQSITDICPTCGQKLVGVEKPDPSPLIAEVHSLQEQAQMVANNITMARNKLNERKSNIKLAYDNSVASFNNELLEANRNYTTNCNERDSIQNSIAELNRMIRHYTTELSTVEGRIASCNNTIIQNQQDIQSIDNQLVYINSSKDNEQSHLDVVNKFETILKRDFRGYLLSTIIDYISIRAKEYCNVIFETDKITFGLDGNNIEISYLDKAYENLSGGEKQKIDLIIQFSIRDMLCNHLGFTSNILVLDEVFDGLDMFGCQKVLDVISAMNDIKNIYIVTHRKDLSIPTDKEIIVIKSENGISELR